jgi:hypothetical protein
VASPLAAQVRQRRADDVEGAEDVGLELRRTSSSGSSSSAPNSP